MYKVSTSYTAGRDLTIGGTTVTKGSTLSKVQVASLKTLQSLVAKRWVIPSPDPNARRGKASTPKPTFITAKAYNAFQNS